MARFLLDTNIVIDALAGHHEAVACVETYGDVAISAVTLIEVLAGLHPRVSAKTQHVLDRLRVIDLDPDIAQYAAAARQERRLDLADAIVIGTAQASGRIVLTRDKDLISPMGDPEVLVPYQLPDAPD